MMKKIAILVLLLCLFLTACGEKSGETTSPPETAAPTKTVYVHSSIVKEFGSAVSRTEFLFDGQDHVTEVVVYSNDTEQMRYSVECDKNGNYIRWSSVGGNVGSVTEYAYDEQGHSLGSTVYMGGALMSSTVYTWEGDKRTSIVTTMQNMEQRAVMTYDERGCLVRQDSYTGGTLTSYTVFANDEDGRPTAATVYQSDGTAVSTTGYTYEGETETRTVTTPDGTVTQTTTLTYDGQGNLLTSAVCDGDGLLLSRETHTWKAVEVPPDCPRASV